MKVMIVGAVQELRQKLAAWIPLAADDQVIEASGMLSALWYADTCRPDLIVLDLPVGDLRCRQMVALLKGTWPDMCILTHEAGGRLRPYVLEPVPGVGAAADSPQEAASGSVLWHGLALPSSSHSH